MKCVIGMAILAAALALAPLPGAGPAAVAAPDATTCEGYPEPRVFLESQSWWGENGELPGGQNRHSHSATCFPLRQRLSGLVTFDIRSMIHGDPGSRLEFVRVQAHNGDGYGVITLASVNPKTPCDTDDCTFWTTITVDTRQLPQDGLTEFRIHTDVQSSDGARNLATNGWIADVRNGKPVHDTNSAQTLGIEGRGWYRDPDGRVFGYENVRFLSPLPELPVSGLWSARVRTLTGSGGDPVSSTLVTIDPSFHAVPEDRGHVLVDGAGPFDGVLPIDTTRLADGPHRLVIAATADEGGGTSLSGVLVIPFTVANAVPLPDEPPKVALTAPASGTTVSGTVALAATATDPDGIERVEFLVDGAIVATDTTGADGWSGTWDTTAVSDGLHTLAARAVDASGTRSVSTPVTVVVANQVATVPLVRLTSPAAGAVLRGTVRLDVSASDPDGIELVEYLVDGRVVAHDDTGDNGFDESWQSASVANGIHTIVARATDRSGASSDSAPVVVTVLNL